MPEGFLTAVFIAFLGSMVALRFEKGRRAFDLNEVLGDVVYGFVGSIVAASSAYILIMWWKIDLENLQTTIELLFAAFIILNLPFVRKHF
jgi:hypothetical protein